MPLRTLIQIQLDGWRLGQELQDNLTTVAKWAMG
jgi:hypothetical protein